MAKRRTPKLTLDAFLEAIQDASGYEDDVLRHLELKPRELHDFLQRFPDARRAALELLEEREVDTSGYRLGWLRGETELSAPMIDDANWARLRELLQEEVVIAGQDVLEASKARTSELVERLRLEKQQAKVAKKSLRERADDEERY
jgi:CRISPR/Cas system CMR subunit Cmr4 (Cas7 group RAMP superfamily)